MNRKNGKHFTRLAKTGEYRIYGLNIGTIAKFDTDGQGAQARPLWPVPKHGRKDGARAMLTPKQKLEMHNQIVRENERKLREWKERGRAA